MVGVSTRKWVWSENFRMRYFYHTLCPRLSSHKLGNYRLTASYVEKVAVAYFAIKHAALNH